jgi:pSer/pThr/pTyr-binding forkhead associated (FHA) protein
LVLQEGPGAGRSFSLDPSGQTTLSLGRSTECNIVLNDHRSSRHHADIRWNGRLWEVVDRGSTNGTYVNGLQVHQPYDLRLGDRVTIGETTFVLSEPSARSPARAVQPQIVPQQPALGAAPSGRDAAGVSVAFWLVGAIVAVAVVCLATGAFLPWLRVEGSLSQDLGPLIQSATDIISSIFGPDSFFHVTQELSGLEGYGKLTLGIAVICAIMLAIDLFLIRESVVPGVVYLLSGLIASGAMASDLVNFYKLYKQVESWSLLFGIQLGEAIEFFNRFIEMKVSPLVGLQITVIGLVLLLVGGVGRLVVALLDRSGRS